MTQDFPKPRLLPLDFNKIDEAEQTKRAAEFCENLKRWRTVREFSDAKVPGIKRKSLGEIMQIV